ncbi:MAG: endopeptidase La [Firmicutes bacterium]|nr:endopeptidase La [Bacillota bacterium]
MIKTDLPVILLRGIVLLPNNDIRLEFDSDVSKNIIDVSELFHDNNILVVSQSDPLEEVPNIKELPKIGVMAKISHKMELPNGKTRIIITGIKRARIYEYLNLNKSSEVLEAIASEIEDERIDIKEERALTRKLYREVEDYIKTVPYMSNSILSLILNVSSLSKMTDMIIPNLPIDISRMHIYLKEISSYKRLQMILEDIYSEKEMFAIEKKLDVKIREELDNTQKEYMLREKIKLIKKELGETSVKEDQVDSLQEKIETLKSPKKIKDRLKKELQKLNSLNQMSPEISIVETYINWLLELPWSLETKDNNNLNTVKNILDKSHYGLDKVKNRIIEYLAVKQMTNSLRSPIICLVGPPGVGKTSLAFSIASAINRNFVKMSVGGVNDEAEIMGHRRTYLGANPGRIIQGMKKAKSINPVFLIDEIDKMTKDIKGDPASALLEVLDPEQNKYFSDNYIEEEYDLSKVMFVATANYIEDIPEALKDRLEVIELSGYTEFEKLDIAKRHLIPKIIKDHGLRNENIEFDDDVLLFIIRHYTKEAGVRELERLLASVVRKVVMNIINKNDNDIKTLITKNNIDAYLGKKKYSFNNNDNSYQIGVVNGLAYTSYGGDTLPIEVSFYKGKGNLVLTGSLGDVMKESAQIALSYIKSNYEHFEINYEDLINNDIHIHVPDGAVPKDGPSAGITLTTALISAFSKLRVPKKIAMTGEITLRGTILPIGGLKEKSIGAYRNGITTIFIPKDNLRDLDEIPKEIKEKIKYIPVINYKEVYKKINEMIVPK